MRRESTSKDNKISDSLKIILITYIFLNIIFSQALFGNDENEYILLNNIKWEEVKIINDKINVIGRQNSKLIIYNLSSEKVIDEIDIPKKSYIIGDDKETVFYLKNSSANNDSLIEVDLSKGESKILEIPHFEVIFRVSKFSKSEYLFSHLIPFNYAFTVFPQKDTIFTWPVNKKKGRIPKPIFLLDDYLFLGIDNKYEISKISKKGKVVSKFTNPNFERKPFTRKEVEALPSNHQIYINPGVDFPPAINEIIKYKKNFLLVINHRRPGTDLLKIDIFNLKEVFIDSMTLEISKKYNINGITTFKGHVYILVENQNHTKIIKSKIEFDGG